MTTRVLVHCPPQSEYFVTLTHQDLVDGEWTESLTLTVSPGTMGETHVWKERRVIVQEHPLSHE